MFKLRMSTVLMVAMPVMVLATSGCATKKYVRNQVNPVNTRVSQLEKHTNDKVAYLNSKEERDISQVNERISTTDQRVEQVASIAQQAQGTASRAMQSSEENSNLIAANTAATNTLASGVANALNYQLVEKGDVTFAFNKATLTPGAKLALDAIVQKYQAQPRGVIELVGFTDKRGSPNYNLALSRRRAEAVERYLVLQKVPLRDIHIVGLGEEAPPENLVVAEEVVNPGATKSQMSRMARRVSIRVFGAGDITQGTASRSER